MIYLFSFKSSGRRCNNQLRVSEPSDHGFQSIHITSHSILIVAATVFYYNVPANERGQVHAASLFDTFDVIHERIGKGTLLTAINCMQLYSLLSKALRSCSREHC